MVVCALMDKKGVHIKNKKHGIYIVFVKKNEKTKAEGNILNLIYIYLSFNVLNK